MNEFNGRVHYHSNAHLSFVIGGACVEKKKFAYDLLPGKITYYSAGEPHQVTRVVEKTQRINLEIEQLFLDQNRITDQIIHNAVSNNPDGKLLMIQIYREFMRSDNLSATGVQMLLLKLITGIGRYHTTRGNPKWTTIVLEVINDRWNETISLEELSKAANVHPVTISRNFASYFSCNLSTYMRKIKVLKAVELIGTSDLSLIEIAYSCGFADQSHFVRAFKEFTGYLPTGYQHL